jgi:hypothetical protein
MDGLPDFAGAAPEVSREIKKYFGFGYFLCNHKSQSNKVL